MDVIVVLPNITSETSGDLNSMEPGGTVIMRLIPLCVAGRWLYCVVIVYILV